MPNIGPLEIAIVLFIVLIIFGPKRLPELGRSLGSGMRGFKDSITGNDKDDDRPEELHASSSKVDATSEQAEREPATAGEERAASGAKPAGDATS
jgi:sec-independent protein translocase protein TatA